ncbi:MAG: hypothetical protein GY725_11635, partial [bacterium]|nr:hypothetical protein [bacterium]
MALLDQLRTIRSARTAGAGATGALGKLAQIRAQRKRSRLATLPELQQESEELEALQQATGANEIAQDQPGFFARTLDVLQGFNFATAGFADEIAQGKGLGAATARATRELLSSARSLPLLSSIIPDVEAQKETFGQVLESAGVGTVTLGDALPALEGTWFGSFVNTRGTLGLALDIATDPLSYFHFGLGGAIRKTFTGLGTKLLTKRGQKLVSGELSTIRKSLDDPRKAQEILLGAGEDVIGRQSRQAGLDRAYGIGRLEAADEATEGVLQRLAFDQAIEKHGADAILDQGGIKWWGRPVVKGKTLRAITSKFGEPATKALQRFSWGDRVITGAEKTYQGMRKVITGIFHPFERLADLPESTREFVIAAARRMRKGEALLAGRYTARVMDSDWFKFFQDNPKLVEGSVSAIEDGAVNGIQNEAQRVASRGVSDFLEELGEDAVALGMITPEQFSTRGGNYFAHFFENNPEEFTEVWQSWAGRLSQVSGKHNKERVFETLKDAE